MEFEIPLGEWLGVIIFLAIGLVLVGSYIHHLKAKKKIKEGMLYGGGVEYLINALRDPGIRDESIEALGKTKDPRAVEALIAFINSSEIREEEDWYELSMGLNALAETQHPKAVDFLIAGLSDNDLLFRCYVCSPLATLAEKGIKDLRAVEPLIALLKDIKNTKQNRDEKEWVEGALEAITGEHFGANLEKWEKWWEENKRRKGSHLERRKGSHLEL